LPKVVIDAEYCFEREGEDFETPQFDFEAHKPKILYHYIENKYDQKLLGKRPPPNYYKKQKLRSIEQVFDGQE
jgi:hypothetical protein